MVNLLLLLFALLCVVRYHVFMSVECGDLSGDNCLCVLRDAVYGIFKRLLVYQSPLCLF